MKQRIVGFAVFLILGALSFYFLTQKPKEQHQTTQEYSEENDEIEENEALNHYMRWKYDADMIKDPTTGEALDLRDKEIEFAKTIPTRFTSSPFARVQVQNTYLPAGPNNQGGRTRGLAYDIRYDGSGNRVILAGGVSGGIYRSIDGGTTWTRVTPANEFHNVSSIVQDPRSGQQNTWYAGGGEYVGSSTDALGATYLGYGLLKSIDNGATWTRLTLSITDIGGPVLGAGVPERFDHTFDLVHRLAVNPTNGHLYIAGHRRIVRSTDGGTSFQVVFGQPNVTIGSAFGANGQTDVVCSPTGKVYIAISGSNPDTTTSTGLNSPGTVKGLRGIWRSTTGNQTSWTKIAGGQTLGLDSVSGWRGNAYDYVDAQGTPFYGTRRTLLALAPSNENILYVLYENGLINTNSTPQSEADLFKLDMTSGNVWTNLSNNMPDFGSPASTVNHEATDPFTIQEGYDLFITVKPDNPNFVILGGTSLYRSTDGFATKVNTSWIGGYGNTLPSLSFYGQSTSNPAKWSHPDIHNLVFNPSNFNEAICANDGGLQKTLNIAGTASGNEPVSWDNLNNYQTIQYYYVTIDPETGANNFAGGTQDNGTQFRDKTGIIGLSAIDSNNHRRVAGGDGSSVGISKKNGSGQQFLFAGVQFGSIRRGQISPSLGVPTGSGFTEIQPNPNGLTAFPNGGSGEYGEFVTNFKLNPDNTDDLYYVNFNRLFRTTSSTTVSSGGWTELTGVRASVNPGNPSSGTNIGIRALAFSRGNYGTSHAMYIGTTNGKIFRLDDPRNAAASTSPVDITPSGISNLNVQDIAVNPNNDNEIIAVISNYFFTNSSNAIVNVDNIWWTDNAKSTSPTWKKAEGNLLGNSTSGFISARSAMITVKKDGSGTPVTEYYVGTAAGLYAVENLGTTLAANGSPTWQRDGSSTLNFSVISSLAYRPADNVLLVGTHGNGIFYTFLGTPNLVTGINNPILNDKNFISLVYPTINASTVQYQIGNKADVKKISVQVYNMQGQELYRQETSYQNGSVSLNRFSKGAYILSIYSDNKKYRHIQKLIR